MATTHKPTMPSLPKQDYTPTIDYVRQVAAQVAASQDQAAAQIAGWLERQASYVSGRWSSDPTGVETAEVLVKLADQVRAQLPDVVAWDRDTVRGMIATIDAAVSAGLATDESAALWSEVGDAVKAAVAAKRGGGGGTRTPAAEDPSRPFARVDVLYRGEKITRRGVNGRKPTAVQATLQAIRAHAGLKDNKAAWAPLGVAALEPVRQVVEQGAVRVDVPGTDYTIVGQA